MDTRLACFPGPHKPYLRFDGRRYTVCCDAPCNYKSEPIVRRVDAVMRSQAHRYVRNRELSERKARR